ncbi:preprotein translocase, YajC subunit [Desulfovibrio sp. X2]|uniref:preprotein translocase subunit YajC n=1 Tax=Desulfovibrio sp. X2 TaxID=941449 RepID=UPI0003589F59|nr:preprotein translocase subunit YajC [Desulfovibrio sp. X2]EPR42248.1 preprotein translocase, YajC subunit [Desulfovibrio sp. X2]
MFFESAAYAMGAAPQGGQGGGNPIMSLLPLILMFAIFYFLLIRPQQKKAKQHKEFLAGLKKGDYVLTGGGIYGRITETEGDTLTVEIADNLSIKVNRNFVSGPAEASEAKGKK